MEFVRDGKGFYHGRIGRYYWLYAHVPPLWPRIMFGRVGPGIITTSTNTQGEYTGGTTTKEK